MANLLTMFMAPLAALFAISLPALIVLYLLKLKRRKFTVPSILLWRESLEDLTANSPFQKLKYNPLMLLQLLLLLLLTLALMRPVFNLDSFAGVDLYVLLDRSASMAATDAAPNRLEAAKETIRQEIDNMGQGDRMMIVAFSKYSEVVVPLTSSRGELLDGLKRVGIQETGTQLSEAMTLLQAAIGDQEERSRILLVSDGKIADSGDLFPPAVETVFIPVGEMETKNLGITRFSLSEDPSGEGYQAFLEISREGDPVPGETSVTVEWEGSLLDAHRIEWAQDELAKTDVFQIPPLSGGVLTAKIEEPDDFPTDDRVGVAISPRPPIEVILLAKGVSSFERVLPLVPETQVYKMAPEALSATTTADVLVFDNCTLETLPEGIEGAFFLGDRPPSEFYVEWAEEPVEYPLTLDWRRTHPVTRGADYRNLQVARAFPAVPPEQAVVLLESRETPLLYALEAESQRVVVANFSAYQSNWTNLYSFPITVTNAVRWLAGRSNRSEVARILTTAEPLEILGRPGSQEMEVMGPSGNSTRVSLQEGQKAYFSGNDLTGQYRLSPTFQEEQAEQVWVNLLDPQESKIEPLEQLPFGQETLQASASRQARNQEIWKYLGLVAFGILLWEWWWYTRQSWV